MSQALLNWGFPDYNPSKKLTWEIVWQPHATIPEGQSPNPKLPLPYPTSCAPQQSAADLEAPLLLSFSHIFFLILLLALKKLQFFKLFYCIYHLAFQLCLCCCFFILCVEYPGTICFLAYAKKKSSVCADQLKRIATTPFHLIKHLKPVMCYCINERFLLLHLRFVSFKIRLYRECPESITKGNMIIIRCVSFLFFFLPLSAFLSSWFCEWRTG